MYSLRQNLALILLAVIGAHALTYFFIGVLPDAAFVSLGIEGVRQESISAFHETHQSRSYGKILLDLCHLNFGTTLDGIPVTQELHKALYGSMPRVLAAFLLVFLSLLAAAFSPASYRETIRSGAASTFLAFLPPYVLPFVGLLILLALSLSFGINVGSGVFNSVATVMLAIAPAALIFTQAQNITHRNLETDFAKTLLAVGASTLYQRYRLLHNLVTEIVPSIEKMFVGLVSVLLFVEPIFGLSGFGTLAIRAIRRSDSDLIMGIVLILSTAVGFFRILALLIRRYYGMNL